MNHRPRARTVLYIMRKFGFESILLRSAVGELPKFFFSRALRIDQHQANIKTLSSLQDRTKKGGIARDGHLIRVENIFGCVSASRNRAVGFPLENKKIQFHLQRLPDQLWLGKNFKRFKLVQFVEIAREEIPITKIVLGNDYKAPMGFAGFSHFPNSESMSEGAINGD